MISWKVGYPNIFFQEICFSGGKQTIHKVSAAFIVKNCHPRTSLNVILIKDPESVQQLFVAVMGEGNQDLSRKSSDCKIYLVLNRNIKRKLTTDRLY